MVRQIKILRITLVALLLTTIFFTAYLGSSAFSFPNLILDKQWGLSERDYIKATSWPEGDAFHLGDSISYFIEIKYNPQTVKEFDKNDLDKINLKPFKIREQKEKEFKIDSNTIIFLKEYKIQLLDGARNTPYRFPAVTVRYKPKDADWLNYQIILQPIFIGSRITSDTAGLKLRPIEGKVVNLSRQNIPWLLTGVGIFCMIWGALEIFLKIRKRQKTNKDRKVELREINDIFEAYRSLALKKNIQPKIILHQAHQILLWLLDKRKESDHSPIQLEINDLLLLCQKAYNQEVVGLDEVSEALKELEKIFDFFIKRGEVR